MKILVTGGAGYIGSHTVLELIQRGHDVVVVDNLCNSCRESLLRVESIVKKKIPLYVCDVQDEKALDSIFAEHAIDAVIHFAALKAVGESVAKPLLYYTNNLGSSMTLLCAMKKYGVLKLVFSSSSCVYGAPETNPISETAKQCPENPYGRTKRMIEEILEDLSHKNENWSITSLRYFNPIGAHESSRIGEDPKGIPNNLLPYINQVAVGKRAELQIFGDEYDTPDGTGIRDYIHVMDLAKAHVAALNHIEHPNVYKAYNISAGVGYSVLQVVAAYEKASGRKIPYKIVAKRAGDVGSYYGDPSLVLAELGWKAEFDLERGCRDSWLWQSNNPDGYGT